MSVDNILKRIEKCCRFGIRRNEIPIHRWASGIHNRLVEYCRWHIEYILCDVDRIAIHIVVFSAGCLP